MKRIRRFLLLAEIQDDATIQDPAMGKVGVNETPPTPLMSWTHNPSSVWNYESWQYVPDDF